MPRGGLPRIIVPAAGGGYLKDGRVRLRFAYHGCSNRPFFHIIVTNVWRARNCQPFEQVGTYDPMPNKDNQRFLSLNLERVRYWLSTGRATFSPPVAELLGLVGLLPINPQTIKEAWLGRQKAAANAAKEEAASKES